METLLTIKKYTNMKTIKNFFETMKNQFNSLSTNLKLVVVNLIGASVGIWLGVEKLLEAQNAGWWSRVFHHNDLATEKITGWILVAAGVLALVLAVTLYIKEELKYKKIDKEIQNAIDEINKADAEEVVVIPC